MQVKKLTYFLQVTHDGLADHPVPAGKKAVLLYETEAKDAYAADEMFQELKQKLKEQGFQNVETFQWGYNPNERPHLIGTLLVDARR